MTRRGRGASAARRVTKVETDSESDDDYDYSNQNANVKRQMEIMMKDLGSETRDRITTTDRNRGGSFSVSAAALERDCNQKGSKAAKLAGQHQVQLDAWSGYHKTSEAKAAGGETLEDLNGGNTHRLRVRSELREGGITNLQDTYFDSRARRGPPSGGPGRGAAAAIANDRGYYSHSRGGSFAGRGMSRRMARGTGHSSTPVPRPLDPALNPERDYSYKSKPPRKKPAQVNMAQGKVTMKPTSNPSQLAQSAPSRPARRPLEAQSPINPRINDTDNFMNIALATFKAQAEASGVIIPIKPEKIVNNNSVSPPQSAPAASSTGPAVTVASTDPVEVREPKTTLNVHPIERDELGKNKKPPDTFTDGQLTDADMSGFSPSIGTEFAPKPASVEGTRAGLGINGVTIKESEDLMNLETPGRNHAGLVEPLLASPKDDGSFSDEHFAENFQLREFIYPEKVHDFAQWRARRDSKDGGDKPSSQQDGQAASFTVSMSSGYKIGGDSLGRIIGDGRNVAAKPKSTLTTPSLMKSMWASPEAEILLDLKTKVTSRLQGKPSTLEPVAEEQVLTIKNDADVRDSFQIKASQDSSLTDAAVVSGPVPKVTARVVQSVAVHALGNEKSTRGGKANPFAPREDPELSAFQASTARGQNKAVQSSPMVHSSKKPNLGKSMADSRWAAAGSQDSSTSETTLMPDTTKTLSASMQPNAKTENVAVASESVQPSKPLKAMSDTVQPKPSSPVRSDKSLTTKASEQSAQPPKPPASNSGLSSSRWSAITEESGADSVSDIGTTEEASVLGRVQTNLPKDDLSNAAAEDARRPMKGVRFEEPLSKASKTLDLSQRSPFYARRGAGPAVSLSRSSSAIPAATIFGDSRNLRKSASRKLKDPASRSAAAITNQLTGALRSSAGRGRAGSTKEPIEQKHMKTAMVDDALEEGEIVEDSRDSVNMLTRKFSNMDLGRGNKR